MQKRWWVGPGPSSNKCPKCASHLAHNTSVRLMNRLVSDSVRTFSAATGLVKLGQPVPESNFASESNSGSPAADAGVGSRLLAIVILAGESPLRALLPGNSVLLGGELLFPLLVTLSRSCRSSDRPLSHIYTVHDGRNRPLDQRYTWNIPVPHPTFWLMPFSQLQSLCATGPSRSALPRASILRPISVPTGTSTIGRR